MGAWRWEGDDLLLAVRVQPRATRERIGGLRGEAVTVHLTAPPVEGAANAALRKLLADALDVAPGRIRIVRGEHAREKTVRISGPSRARVEALLAGCAPE
ncbi:MAG: YggU family protein [Magnetococcales bacterium]|nr:YggU family protein [Magnetococcales bacterium]